MAISVSQKGEVQILYNVVQNLIKRQYHTVTRFSWVNN
jgi:hypothetical protein